MLIRPVDFKDLESFCQMLESRDLPLELITDVPAFGLIAYKQNQVIAYGAIRCIEGNRAMLDSYITHKDASAEDRNRALDLITYKLIKIAYNENIKQLLAFSADTNTILRAERHGFITNLSNKFQILSLTV